MKVSNAREHALAVRKQQEIVNDSAGRNFALTAEETTEMASLDDGIRQYLSQPAGGVRESLGDSCAGASGPSGNVRVLPLTDEQKDHDLGVMIHSKIVSVLTHRPAHEIALEFGNERVAAESMSANSHSGGGSWISGAYSDRFIELLRPESVVRMMGADELPLEDGTLSIPKETGGATGRYLGENEDAEIESLTTGDVMLIAKELVCIVPASDKLLRSRSAKAAERIRNSVIRGCGQTEDLYFLRGTPAGAGPIGMRYLELADNIFAANAVVNLANVTSDLGKCEQKLMSRNVRMRKAGWIMSPRSFIFLAAIQNGNGMLAFPEMSSGKPMLRGKPVFVTTQIPDNLGSGSDSEIMLADAEHLLIGDVPNVNLDSSNSAAYLDGGTMKAAFTQRKTLVRLVMENDFNTAHAGAIAVMTEVTWGA